MRRTGPEKGVYALCVRVTTNQTIEIGKLGRRELSAGVYVYIGSALNSLPGRISRYLRRDRKKHWHIDYLLDAKAVQPLGVAWKLTNRRIECSISRKIENNASTSVNGFGCSDCDCSSHLHLFPFFQEAAKAITNLGFCYPSLEAFVL